MLQCYSLGGEEKTKMMRYGQVPEAAGSFQILMVMLLFCLCPLPATRPTESLGVSCLPTLAVPLITVSPGPQPRPGMDTWEPSVWLGQTDEWEPRMTRLPAA